jgi:hypothetical protein
MLGGIEWNELETLGARLRRSWTDFARTGLPEGDAWPTFAKSKPLGKRWNFTRPA